MMYPPPTYLTGHGTAADKLILAKIQYYHGNNISVFKCYNKFTRCNRSLSDVDEHGANIIFFGDDSKFIAIFTPSQHGCNGVVKVFS